MANLFRCGKSGSKLRTLSRYCSISSGTWSGATLSDSSYVALASSSVSSTWTYKFDKIIDLTKVNFISASIMEGTNGIRFHRGYAQNSSTEAFYYIPIVSIFGNTVSGTDVSKGGIATSDDSTYIYISSVNYFTNISSTNSATFEVHLYSDKIVFNFIRGGHNWGSLKSTSPQFLFTIGYID